MTDLAPVQGKPCSNGSDLNNQGQVVGNSTDCHGGALAATLWEGGSAFDLNTLVGQSPLRLTESFHISNQGEIVARGYLSNGDQRMVLLVPASSAASGSLRSVVNGKPVPAAQRAATIGRRLPNADPILGATHGRLRPEYRFQRP